LRRVTGSHHIYTRPGSRAHLSVPIHRNKPLKVGTLRALLRAAELTEDDL
jgi:predicted RNA binding protein YcfA (HicA-like mRNA interferase family)